jgi:small-conductance mechanosensitive channel
MNLDWPNLSVLLREGLFVVFVLVGTLLLWRSVNRSFGWLAGKLQAPPLTLRPLVVVARSLLVILALGVLAGHIFAIDFVSVLGGVLALVGIGFVAVWSTLSNVLCTLFLLTVRPFHIGDELELPPDPLKGRIVDLNLFFTVLQAADGRFIQIPNNWFFQRAVIRRRAAAGPELAQQLARDTATTLPAIVAGRSVAGGSPQGTQQIQD